LCGGTHLQNTSEIGAFQIVSEEGVSAGTRRVVALTGQRAAEHLNRTASALIEAARTLGATQAEVPAAAKTLVDTIRDLRKQIAGGGSTTSPAHSASTGTAAQPVDPLRAKSLLRETARILNVAPFDVPARLAALASEAESLKQQLAQRQAAGGAITAQTLLDQAQQLAGVTVVVAEAPAADANLMRSLIDQLRRKASPCAVLLASSESAEKVTLVAGLSRELVERGMSAGLWVREVAPVVGGGGGGRPDMAQAGGKRPDQLPAALDKARQTIQAALAS
jgi:alanyl-tRNA synthetase